MVAIAVPIYYLCKPPQPQPYDWFPFAALRPRGGRSPPGGVPAGVAANAGRPQREV